MLRQYKTVASSLVRIAMRLTAAQGVPGDAFYRATGVTREEVVSPHGRVPWPKWARALVLLHRLAKRAPHDLADCLSWLEVELPILGGVLLNAPSLREALGRFLVYQPILTEADRFTWFETDALVRIEHATELPQRLADSQAMACFALLAHVVRAYEQEPTPVSIGLAGSPGSPALVEVWRSLCQATVRQQQPASYLELPRRDLDRPFPLYNPAVDAILRPRLEDELTSLGREASLASRAERALRRMVLEHRATMSSERVLAKLCEELGMTRWTLQRRLATEGHTFRELHARVRIEEARRLLAGSALSLAELSEQLGFSSQSTFARFFRGKVGLAPLRYRSEAARGSPLPSSRRSGARRDGGRRQRLTDEKLPPATET